MRADPKSAKRLSSHWCLFALLGSTLPKAAHKTLVKLATGVNFINILQAAFTHADPKSKK